MEISLERLYSERNNGSFFQVRIATTPIVLLYPAYPQHTLADANDVASHFYNWADLARFEGEPGENASADDYDNYIREFIKVADECYADWKNVRGPKPEHKPMPRKRQAPISKKPIQ